MKLTETTGRILEEEKNTKQQCRRWKLKREGPNINLNSKERNWKNWKKELIKISLAILKNKKI